MREREREREQSYEEKVRKKDILKDVALNKIGTFGSTVDKLWV